MQQLDVVEVIKKAESGITEPYLCRLSDDREYYVKGRAATPRGLVAELLCAQLGQAFGLPIPEYTLTRATAELLDPGAMSSLGTGVLFASLKRGGAVPVSSSNIDLINISEQQRLFLFDAWVQNEDRTQTEHGGNPNYFISAETGDPFVIDHNLAFEVGFDLARNFELHVCRDAWTAAMSNLLSVQSLRAEIEQLLPTLDGLRYSIPEEWLDYRPAMVDEFITVLSRAGGNQFWNALNG